MESSAPFDCEVWAVIKFLNAGSVSGLEIYCRLINLYSALYPRPKMWFKQLTLCNGRKPAECVAEFFAKQNAVWYSAGICKLIPCYNNCLDERSDFGRDWHWSTRLFHCRTRCAIFSELFMSMKNLFATHYLGPISMVSCQKGEHTKMKFFGSGSKFFECFAVRYYHISMKLLEVTKCYSTWKASCFWWYHSFSKIFIHIVIMVHTHFCTWRLHSFVHHHLWTIGQMRQSKVDVTH